MPDPGSKDVSLDLFTPEQLPPGQAPPKLKYPVNGYAARPGSGPDGRRCKHCEHFAVHENGNCTKKFFKCRLMRHEWTNGYGSDIRSNSPACKYFEEAKDG